MAERKDDEYQLINFYKNHSKVKQSGFSKFDAEGSYYFCRFVDGDIALISQAYASAAGRDNGIESVRKNEKIKTRYKFETRAKGQYGFSLKAGNHQEIAISPNYTSASRAENVAGRLNGSVKTASKKAAVVKPRAANVEQDYKPLAFYQKHIKSREKGSGDGIEKFKGDDGKYYFAYFENDQIVLISEGYPTQNAQNTGAASVEKNLPIAARYKYRGPLKKSGKYDFTLKAGNHKEIARSRWYGSAEAAAAGAAYLMGTRKRSKAAPIAAAGATAGLAGASLAAAAAAKSPTPKPPTPKPPTPKPAAPKPVVTGKPIAAAPIVAAGAAAATATAGLKAKPAAAPIAAAPVVADSGGGIWGWLKWLLLALLALLVLLFLFKSCSKDTASVKAPVAAAPVTAETAPEPTPIPEPIPDPTPEPISDPILEPAPEPTPAPIPEAEPIPDPVPPATPVSSGLSCACGSSSSPIFNIPLGAPKHVSYLGSNPQFGDSHGLSPAEFYQKLAARYNGSAYDAGYLDYTFKALGYEGGFSDVDASVFRDDNLPKGAEGILGFGQSHALQYSKLNVPSRDLRAFRVTSRNGCDVHFMKTCGNYMYACNP